MLVVDVWRLRLRLILFVRPIHCIDSSRTGHLSSASFCRLVVCHHLTRFLVKYDRQLFVRRYVLFPIFPFLGELQLRFLGWSSWRFNIRNPVSLIYSTVWIILQTSPLFDCVASYLFHMDFSSTEMCFNVSFYRDTWHDNRTVFFGVLAYYLFWKCKCVTSLIANKLTTTILIFLLSCNKVLQRIALDYLWRHKQTLAFKYSRLYSDFIPMTSQQLFIFTSSLLQILHPQPLPWLQFALNQASGWVAWHRTRRVDREIILEVGELSTRINIGFTRSWQLLLTSGS